MYKRLFIYSILLISFCGGYFGYVSVYRNSLREVQSESAELDLPLWQDVNESPERFLKVLRFISDSSQDRIKRGRAEFLLGYYYFERGEPEIALDFLTGRFIPETNLRNRAVHLQGRALLEIGTSSEAALRFSDLDSYPFWKEKSAYYKAQCYLDMKNTDAFEAALPVLGDESAAELLFRAGSLENLDKTERTKYFMKIYFEYPASVFAEEAGKMFNTEDVGNEVTWLGRARLLFGKKRYNQALNSYERIRDLPYQDRISLGICQYMSGKHQDAVNNLSRFEEGRAQYYTAKIYLKSKSYSNYEKHILKAIRTRDAEFSAKAVLDYCGYLEERDRTDECVTILTETLASPLSDSGVLDMNWKLGWMMFRNAEYSKALDRFSAIVKKAEKHRDRLKAAYWTCRCLEKTGRVSDASAGYIEIATKFPWNYYGIRSSERLETIGKGTAEADRNPYFNLEVLPSYIRDGNKSEVPLDGVIELEKMGLFEAACDELEFLQGEYPENLEIATMRASVYTRQREYYRAMRALTKTVPVEVIESGLQHFKAVAKIVYPLEYLDLIERESRSKGLDPMLVAGLINQESYFIPNAKSGAGAVGLMQIMPGTGRMISNMKKDREFSVNGLFSIEKNINYGVYYFAEIMKDFNGVIEYSLAGYNAGPGRARRWSAVPADLDVFVENIPFDETRDYVKKVYSKYRAYQEIYDLKGDLKN